MKKTTVGLSGIALAAALSLSACGGDADELAGEYCELLEEVQEATESGDADQMTEAVQAASDWAEEHKDDKVDEGDFTDAVKDECPDFADQLP